MKQTITNTAQTLNSTLGGRGAKVYIKPCIELIKLDNEISLALESAVPPEGPNEGVFLSPEFSKNNPYQSQWS